MSMRVEQPRLDLDRPLLGCLALFAIAAGILCAGGFCIVRWVLT